jgi:hypothetical protein
MDEQYDLEIILKDQEKLTPLSALSMACILYDLPSMRELWDRAHPESPLSEDDEATLMFEGMEESARIRYDSPDDRTLIVDLLRESGFSRLADVTKKVMD